MSNALRRLVDVAVALAVLVVGSPVIATLAVAVRFDLGSPVLYRQQRLGHHGRPFTLLKFRSMHRPRTGREGSEFDGERVSRLGSLLRSSSLDELPGFVNLLRGDITLVGPRPLPVAYWDRFVGAEYRRFDVRPGITGLAQVSGRNTLDWDERLALDVSYVQSRSLRLDLSIVRRTIPLVLARRGVNSSDGSGDEIVTMTELPADRNQPAT